ncbi:hypothetical protein PENSPDRAFT_694097 [Peniophora sp. CONT]|nr:hypothetical protein PENSPDRAFT_694097 [Peniophora sp. CONT]
MSHSYWNIADWTFEEHMRRARTQYPNEWPANDADCNRELGPDGLGTLNILQRAGLDIDLRKDDIFVYVGDDDGHPAPPEHALFQYGHIGAVVDDGAPDDLNAPDDPNALAPQEGADVWVLVIKEIVSFVGPAGGVITWVLGQSLSTPSYLLRNYARRCERIAGVLGALHPREHLLTDLWQAARIHSALGKGQLRSLNEFWPALPPPVGIPDILPVWYLPGCLHYLDDVRNATQRQALEFRSASEAGVCECSAPVCSDRTYDRSTDVMARCVDCERWYHHRCIAEAPEGAVFDTLEVSWEGGALSGPPTRRAPNAGDQVTVDTPRGLRVRVDPPVRSWERVAAAVREARWESGDDLFMSNGSEFFGYLREGLRGADFDPTRPRISDDELECAVQSLLDEGTSLTSAWPLTCPFCQQVI